MNLNGFKSKVTPDWEAFRECILRKGTSRRVHHFELFLDGEIQEAIIRRFNLLDGLSPGSPYFQQERTIRLQRFLGYDYVRQGLEGLEMPLNFTKTEDTADLSRDSGRSFVSETTGPITNWEEFNKYPWPDPHKATDKALAWYERNLPDDMCVIGSGGFAHFAEYITWLMGYETLCYSIYDSPDLVQAIAQKLLDMYEVVISRILAFDRVKVICGSDDMGFKTGPLISVDQLRSYVFPGHRRMAAASHAAGRPYLLHTCGNLSSVMEDLIEDVKIDAKHSFEDTIEDVRDAKKKYGRRLTLLGGLDVDFMCRATEQEVRARVRNTLDACMPGGGYCLGTGNSVANYIPLDSYLAMLDEGRLYSPSV